jgi:hypothetical protein
LLRTRLLAFPGSGRLCPLTIGEMRRSSKEGCCSRQATERESRFQIRLIKAIFSIEIVCTAADDLAGVSRKDINSVWKASIKNQITAIAEMMVLRRSLEASTTEFPINCGWVQNLEQVLDRAWQRTQHSSEQHSNLPLDSVDQCRSEQHVLTASAQCLTNSVMIGAQLRWVHGTGLRWHYAVVGS